MKCIHCDRDATYSERADGKCPGCRHAFAFEPRSGDPITDSAFKHAIDLVSSQGSVRFTGASLLYEIARRIKRPGSIWGRYLAAFFVPLGLGIAGLVITIANAESVGGPGGARLLDLWLPRLGLGVLALEALGFAWAWKANHAPWLRLDESTFSALLAKWICAHGEPAGRIIRRPRVTASADRARPRDLESYSFDRAVVCDREDTVDLLLANNFHFENNCAVLSESGYPPEAAPQVRAMLKRNPKLLVLCLHDATPSGCALAHRVRCDPDLVLPTARVVDVGLRPVHAAPFRGMLLRAGAPVSSNLDITKAEATWLSKFRLELAAVRPEQVLKRLYRALSAATAPSTVAQAQARGTSTTNVWGGVSIPSSAGRVESDTTSFAADADASDGGDGADGFG